MKKYILVGLISMLSAGAASAQQPAGPQPLPTGMQYMQQENSQLGQQISVKTVQISQLLDELTTQKKWHEDCVADFDRCRALVEKEKADAAKKATDAALKAAGTTKTVKDIETPKKP